MDLPSDGESKASNDAQAAVKSLQQIHLHETEADGEEAADDEGAVPVASEDHKRDEIDERQEPLLTSELSGSNNAASDTDSDSTSSDLGTRPTGEKADSLLIEAAAHKEEGNEHFKQGSLDMAARSYRRGCQAIKCLAHDDTVDEQVSSLHLALHTNLSMVLFQLQKHQQSVEVASKALRMEPNHVKALYRRAVAYRAMGRLEKAKSDLQSALQLDAKNVACRKEWQAIQLDLQASKENEKKSLAKAFSGKLSGKGSLLYEDKELEEKKRKKVAEQRKKEEQEQYKKRKQQWEDECVKRMAKNEPAISFEEWEKEEKEKEKKRRKEEETKRKEREKQRKQELKARRAQQKECEDDSDSSEITEKELAMMRGYKLTKDGRKTSYFTRELPEDVKHQYHSAIAPKRLDSNGDLESQVKAPSYPAPASLSNGGAVTSAWNAAGTWEEKDTTSWCTSQLRKRLEEITIASEEYDADIVEVKNVSGHASVAFTAGKKRYIFEYEADLKYEIRFSTDGSVVASGSIKLPDIESASHEEPEVTFGSWKKHPASEFQDMALEARRHLTQQVRLQVRKWVEDFNTAY